MIKLGGCTVNIFEFFLQQLYTVVGVARLVYLASRTWLKIPSFSVISCTGLKQPGGNYSKLSAYTYKSLGKRQKEH